MPQRDFQRRKPYKPLKLSQLQEAQGRAAVLGTLVNKDKENYTFVIDDGKNQVLAIINDIKAFDKLEEGKPVRVMGKLVGSGEETEILADAVQDFSGVDKELYTKHVVAKA